VLSLNSSSISALGVRGRTVQVKREPGGGSTRYCRWHPWFLASLRIPHHIPRAPPTRRSTSAGPSVSPKSRRRGTSAHDTLAAMPASEHLRAGASKSAHSRRSRGLIAPRDYPSLLQIIATRVEEALPARHAGVDPALIFCLGERLRVEGQSRGATVDHPVVTTPLLGILTWGDCRSRRRSRGPPPRGAAARESLTCAASGWPGLKGIVSHLLKYSLTDHTHRSTPGERQCPRTRWHTGGIRMRRARERLLVGDWHGAHDASAT